MATLFLMCGPPGSGRTALAKRIERAAPRSGLSARLDAWCQVFEPSTPGELRPRPARP